MFYLDKNSKTSIPSYKYIEVYKYFYIKKNCLNNHMKNKQARLYTDCLAYPGSMTDSTIKLSILVFTLLYSITEKKIQDKKDRIF